MTQRIANHYRRTEGRYNWADPTEWQANYQFVLRPDAPIENFSVVVPLASDYEPIGADVVKVAKWLLSIKERYLYSGDVTKLQPLIAYLESVELIDERDDLIWHIERQRQTVAEATERLELYERQLERVNGYIAEEVPA